jgi:hypothetical protein
MAGLRKGDQLIPPGRSTPSGSRRISRFEKAEAGKNIKERL